MSTNVEHGPDWSDWQEGDDDPSCKCGFNGSQRECAADRISRAFAHGVNFASGVVL